MSELSEVEKLKFQNIRVYVWSIQKYNLSVALIVAMATLLLRNACHFFRGKIARNGQYRLDIGLLCKISL